MKTALLAIVVLAVVGGSEFVYLQKRAPAFSSQYRPTVEGASHAVLKVFHRFFGPPK